MLAHGSDLGVTTLGCKEFSSTETFLMSLKKPTHSLLYLLRLSFLGACLCLPTLGVLCHLLA